MTDTNGHAPALAPLVLITRPAEDAAPLLDAIRAVGLDGMVEPMLRIEPRADAQIDIDDCRALLFTSANGVRAFSRFSTRRDLPVIAVGPASALAASEAGFEDVEAAAGDVDALIESVQARFSPGEAPFFHAAGTVTAGDLKGRLEAIGYRVRREHLYNAEPATGLSDACLAAFDSGRIAATTFFSPRTATAFVRLLEESGRAPRARTVWAICLSEAVAAEARAIEWTGTKVAETRDTAAMIAALAETVGPGATSVNAVEPATMNKAGAMTEDKTKPDNETEDAIADGDTIAEPVDDLNADAVIEAFGGIRPMASKLDVAVSTVQGWKTRGHIPDSRWRDIIAAAGAHDIDLSAALPKDGPAEREADDGAAESETPWSEEANEQSDAAGSVDAAAGDTDSHDMATEQRNDTEESAAQPTSEDVAPDSPQDERPATASQGGGKLALLVGVAAILAVVARPVWGPYVDPHLAKYIPQGTSGSGAPMAPATPSVDLSELNAEIADLRARLQSVEERPVAIQSPPGEDGDGVVSGMTTRLSALEGEISELRGAINSVMASIERDDDTRARLLERLGVIESLTEQATTEAERAMAGLAGVEATLNRQDDAIAALERRPAIEGAAQAGLALAVGDVESAMADGRPFSDALLRLQALAENDPAIAEAAGSLVPYAASGVPTDADLLAAFRREAPAMQTELGKTDGDVLDTLLNGARSLVSVRRKGDAPDAPPVSRAEAALARGDLTGAVAALTPVRDVSTTVDLWLAGAEARLAAEAALRNLRRTVAAGLNGVRDGDSKDGDGA